MRMDVVLGISPIYSSIALTRYKYNILNIKYYNLKITITFVIYKIS